VEVQTLSGLLGHITFMESFKLLAKLIDSIIWMVGLMTIFVYGYDHWPTFYIVTTDVLLGGVAVWYFWKFFLAPFKDGSRER